MHKLLIGKPNNPNGELKKSTGIVAKLRWFDPIAEYPFCLPSPKQSDNPRRHPLGSRQSRKYQRPLLLQSLQKVDQHDLRRLPHPIKNREVEEPTPRPQQADQRDRLRSWLRIAQPVQPLLQKTLWPNPHPIPKNRLNNTWLNLPIHP